MTGSMAGNSWKAYSESYGIAILQRSAGWSAKTFRIFVSCRYPPWMFLTVTCLASVFVSTDGTCYITEK
tara:strand:+ start:465 stop:671 length:207 start_codon:yes stop_codon:yes gene_type:complete